MRSELNLLFPFVVFVVAFAPASGPARSQTTPPNILLIVADDLGYAPSISESGFSASPVAADGRIYISSEDGEMVLVAAGREFKHIATNSMGDQLMATPALSEGVMYLRGATALFAIGRKRS